MELKGYYKEGQMMVNRSLNNGQKELKTIAKRRSNDAKMMAKWWTTGA